MKLKSNLFTSALTRSLSADVMAATSFIWNAGYNNRSSLKLRGILSLTALSLLGWPSARAADQTWDGSASTSWSNAANWSGNALPSGANDTATFSGTFGTGTAITLGGNQNTADLTISTTTDFSISDNILTLTKGDITRSAVSGTTTINSGIDLGDTSIWNIAGSLIANGIISGATTLEKTGAGTLTLAGNNSFNGGMTLSTGTLRATTSVNALGVGTLSLVGGILQLADDTGLNFARNTSVDGNATIESDRVTSGAGVTHTLGTLDIKASLLTLNKGSSVTSGTIAGMTFGVTTLSVNNTTFSASAETLLTLASIQSGAQNRSFTVTGAGNTVSGAITTNAGGLAKTGTGTLTLSGASTYTGTTSVTGGKLVVNGTLGNTQVTVGGGAILSGTGTIGTNAAPSGVPTAGVVILNAGAADSARGAIDLTNGSIGTLSFAAKDAVTSVLTIGGALGNTSILSFDVGATTDQIALGTNARLNIGAGGGLVRLTSLGGLTNTTQTLISSTTASVGIGTLANMTIDSTTGNFSGFTLGLVVNGNNLDLGKTANAAAAAAYWKGTNDGVWTTFTGGNANISNFATDLAGTNATGKVGATTDVFFNATTAANFGNTALGEDFTIKSLTYGGNAASAVGIGGSNTLTIMNGVTVATLSGNHTIGTKVALGGNQTWTVTDVGQTLTASNQISGAFALTKAGAGTLTLSGANNYSGLTTVSAGTLAHGASDVLSNGGVTVDGASAILNLAGFSDTVGAFTLANGGTLSGSGTLTGTSYALQGGTVNANLGIGTANVTTGTTVLNGTSASALVNINSGSFSLGANDRLSNGATVTIAGGALDTTASNWSDTIGTFNISSGSLNGGGTITAASYALTGGTVNANLGAGSLTANSGSTILNGTTAATSLDIAGALTLGSASRFTGASAALTITGTGSLTMGGSESVGSLAGVGGTLNLGASNLTIANTGGSTTFSGGINGAGGLTKDGASTQILSGANTYTGDTIIKTGTLKLDGSAGLASANIVVGDAGSSGANLEALGGLTIAAGQTVSGIGTINGPLTFQGNIAPGNSAGMLTHLGNIDLQTGSQLQVEINGANPASHYDQLNVQGAVTLAGMLDITMGYTPPNDALFFIVINDLSEPITGTFSNAAVQGNTYTFGIQQFAISYLGNYENSTFTGGNDVVLMAVPEPAAALLGGIGVLFLLRRRRVA